MHGPQEVALGQRSPPPAFHGDDGAVVEDERGNIERVGMAMLGQPSAMHMVHGPARIGAGNLQPHDIGTQMIARRRHDDVLHPMLHRRNHRAAQQRRRLQGNQHRGPWLKP